MAKLILSQASQKGIQGAKKGKLKTGKKYEELVKEADKRIEENRYRYANAYKKAEKYLAR